MISEINIAFIVVVSVVIVALVIIVNALDNRIDKLEGMLSTDYVSQRYYDTRSQTLWNEITKLQAHKAGAESIFHELGWIYDDRAPRWARRENTDV